MCVMNEKRIISSILLFDLFENNQFNVDTFIVSFFFIFNKINTAVWIWFSVIDFIVVAFRSRDCTATKITKINICNGI